MACASKRGARPAQIRRTAAIRSVSAAASARIGVAEADYYPRFALNGSIGVRSKESETLFEADSLRYAWGPSFSWNLFATGRVQANVRAFEEQHKQTLAAYEQTVLLALEETRNAVTSFLREQERRELLGEGEAASREAVELARELYSRGVTDFQTVLIAERTMFAAEEARALSDRDVTTNLIVLFKALGGGWQDLAPAPHDDDTPGALAEDATVSR